MTAVLTMTGPTWEGWGSKASVLREALRKTPVGDGFFWPAGMGWLKGVRDGVEVRVKRVEGGWWVMRLK